MTGDANLETLPTLVPEISEITVPDSALHRPMRKLLRSSGIYALTSFAVKGSNFLLIALYSRFLRPADYGIVALSEVTAMLVSTLMGLGLSSALLRFYFEYADNASHQQRYIGTLLRFSLAIIAASLALAMLAGALAPNFFVAHLKVVFFPYLALALGAAAGTQLVDFRSGLYQAEQQPKKFAWLSVVSFLLVTFGVVLFVVVQRRGATGLLLGKCVGALCTALISLWLLRRWWNAGWDSRDIVASLRFGLPLVPHQILALGLVAADRFILSRYRDMNEVGIYSLAYTLGMVMYMFTAAVSMAWAPMFYEQAKKGEAGRKTISSATQHLMALLTLIACFGILVAQPFTSWFLDARYAQVGRLVPWIVASYLFHSFTSLFQMPLLQAKRTSMFSAVTAFALVLNLGLNIAWIPRWGMYGAACATLAAYAAQTLLMYFLAQSAFRLSYGGAKLTLWVALVCGMLLVSQSALASQPQLMLPILVVVVLALVLIARQVYGAELPLLWGSKIPG